MYGSHFPRRETFQHDVAIPGRNASSTFFVFVNETLLYAKIVLLYTLLYTLMYFAGFSETVVGIFSRGCKVDTQI